MDDRFLLHFLAAMIFLIYGVQAGNIYFRWRTKYNLAQLIITTIFFTGTVLNYFYPQSIKIFGGAESIIPIVVISLIVLAYFLFYPDIKQYLYRRKMKGKLNTIERGLLFYCLAKHNPQILHNSYYQLDSGGVDAHTINEMRSIVGTELANNGTGPDSEPNEHGLQLKSLIDRLAELYLSPESEK